MRRIGPWAEPWNTSLCFNEVAVWERAPPYGFEMKGTIDGGADSLQPAALINPISVSETIANKH